MRSGAAEESRLLSPPKSIRKTPAARREVWGGVSMPWRQDSCHRAERPGRGGPALTDTQSSPVGPSAHQGTRRGRFSSPHRPSEQPPPAPT